MKKEHVERDETEMTEVYKAGKTSSFRLSLMK